MLSIPAPAQSGAQQGADIVTSKYSLKQLLADDVYVFVCQAVADSLITHRVEPTLPRWGMVGRVSGTVIVAFEITKEGKIRYPIVVSGPKLLQGPVIQAVRAWTFKPYSIQGEPIAVATSVSVTCSNF